MDASFWHQRWASNNIGFHQKEANPLLVRHFSTLSIAKGGRVFVPLCGKTLDIAWLLSEGYPVAGAELSELAIQQLFAALQIEPHITQRGEIKQYSAPDLDIFVGDIFHVSGDMLGAVDAIFDRAALVALPEPTRIEYAEHLTHITQAAPQLLITYEYDQRLTDGPPFSVPSAEIYRHYQARYEVQSLARVAVGLRGRTPAMEQVWHLKPR